MDSRTFRSGVDLGCGWSKSSQSARLSGKNLLSEKQAMAFFFIFHRLSNPKKETSTVEFFRLLDSYCQNYSPYILWYPKPKIWSKHVPDFQVSHRCLHVMETPKICICDRVSSFLRLRFLFTCFSYLPSSTTSYGKIFSFRVVVGFFYVFDVEKFLRRLITIVDPQKRKTTLRTLFRSWFRISVL